MCTSLAPSTVAADRLAGRFKGVPYRYLLKSAKNIRIDQTSTDVESVLIQLNPRRLFAHVNRDDIEPTRTVDQPVPRQVVLRDAGHPPALEPRHRFHPGAKLAPFARLDLDEDDGLAIARDDVQFSTATPISTGKNCVPATLQLLAGEIFAQFPQ